MPSTGDKIEIANLNEIKTAAETVLTATGQTYTWQTEVETGDIIDTTFLEEVVAAMDLAYDNMKIAQPGDITACTHNSTYKGHTAYLFRSDDSYYVASNFVTTPGCSIWYSSFNGV